jgi:hypothetical protein
MDISNRNAKLEMEMNEKNQQLPPRSDIITTNTTAGASLTETLTDDLTGGNESRREESSFEQHTTQPRQVPSFPRPPVFPTLMQFQSHPQQMTTATSNKPIISTTTPSEFSGAPPPNMSHTLNDPPSYRNQQTVPTSAAVATTKAGVSTTMASAAPSSARANFVPLNTSFRGVGANQPQLQSRGDFHLPLRDTSTIMSSSQPQPQSQPQQAATSNFSFPTFGMPQSKVKVENKVPMSNATANNETAAPQYTSTPYTTGGESTDTTDNAYGSSGATNHPSLLSSSTVYTNAGGGMSAAPAMEQQNFLTTYGDQTADASSQHSASSSLGVIASSYNSYNSNLPTQQQQQQNNPQIQLQQQQLQTAPSMQTTTTAATSAFIGTAMNPPIRTSGSSTNQNFISSSATAAAAWSQQPNPTHIPTPPQATYGGTPAIKMQQSSFQSSQMATAPPTNSYPPGPPPNWRPGYMDTSYNSQPPPPQIQTQQCWINSGETTGYAGAPLQQQQSCYLPPPPPTLQQQTSSVMSPHQQYCNTTYYNTNQQHYSGDFAVMQTTSMPYSNMPSLASGPMYPSPNSTMQQQQPPPQIPGSVYNAPQSSGVTLSGSYPQSCPLPPTFTAPSWTPNPPMMGATGYPPAPIGGYPDFQNYSNYYPSSSSSGGYNDGYNAGYNMDYNNSNSSSTPQYWAPSPPQLSTMATLTPVAPPALPLQTAMQAPFQTNNPKKTTAPAPASTSDNKKRRRSDD